MWYSRKWVNQFLVLLAFAVLLAAQSLPLSNNALASSTPAESSDFVVDQPDRDWQQAVVQLAEIHQSLMEKRSQRQELAAQIKQAGRSASDSLQSQLRQLDEEIALLNKTFEQIAIGGVDLSVFGVQQDKFDWREELVLIVKPLIENVKGLTEKPRKIESLRRVIRDKTAAQEASEEALASIEQLEESASEKQVVEKLKIIREEWGSRLEEAAREKQLAQYQLNSLEGKDIPWIEILHQGAIRFFQGRGLTLVIVVIVATAVWFLMRGILTLIRLRTSSSRDSDIKVHYRLAAYGYRFLTAILIAVAVITVLYLRRDLLLLAIVLVVFFGVALAMRNLLPKYIVESRLLLNIGPVRERERVIFNGLPWEVSSINMFSRFVNPELRGGLRIPLGHMHDLISRPVVKESWFPSSEGDWILTDDDSPSQVIVQTPDVVELRDLNAVPRYIPTQDFYSAGYPNISRADAFRVAATFGIDYQTQSEDMESVTSIFATQVHDELLDRGYDDLVVKVDADFHSAGDSSLNYIILAVFKPEAAGAYNRIKRAINAACVKACSKNKWPIPFPQMSIHVESDNVSQNDR